MLFLCFINLCLGQVSGSGNSTANGTEKKYVIKLMKVYTSEKGLFKMGKPRLTQKIHFDKLARIIKNVELAYSMSYIGIDTAITEQEYLYHAKSNKVQLLKIKNIVFVDKTKYIKEVMFKYDENGNVLYQHDGTRQIGDSSVIDNSVGSKSVKMAGGTSLNKMDASMKRFPLVSPRLNRGAVTNRAKEKLSEDIKHYDKSVYKGEEDAEVVEKHESIANGYIVTLTANSGKLLEERKVLLNDKKQIVHVINIVYGLSNEENKISVESRSYDLLGNEVQRTVLNERGKEISKRIFSYDQNNELEKAIWSKKGKVYKIFKYKYDYF